MNILDRYLAAAILVSSALVMAVLISLFSFVQFVDALGDVGKADYQLADAIRFVVLSIPRQTFEVFPMAALLGTTLGLSALAADSELIAMRAAGVPVMRIVRSAVQVGLVLALAAVAIGEFIVPQSEQLAERGRAEALKIRIKQQNDFGLWLRDASDFVHVGEVLPDLSLLGIDLYRFDEHGQMTLHLHSKHGSFADSRWHIEDVRESVLTRERVQTRRVDSLEWNTGLTPDLFSVFRVRPEALSVVQLYRYIRHLEQNRQNAENFALAFWQKLIAPFSTVVMMVLAIPFVFGSQRSGGIGARLFTGIVIGLAFFVVSRGFGYFGLLHGIPAVIGAILPTLLFLGAAVFMLNRVR